ncbi:hypothetical protein [Lacinutrix undariae]
MNNNQENNLLRYFIQVDESNFNINTSYKITGVEKINLNHFNDFNVISVTSNSNGSNIKISRKSKKRLQGLKISFYDSDDIFRNIQINFYSNIVDIHQLDIGQKISFDRTVNIVPPLFLMSSLQTGKFIICEENNIIYNFDSLTDLYFFSLRASSGEYFIGEKTCQNSYFSLDIE